MLPMGSRKAEPRTPLLAAHLPEIHGLLPKVQADHPCLERQDLPVSCQNLLVKFLQSQGLFFGTEHLLLRLYSMLPVSVLTLL